VVINQRIQIELCLNRLSSVFFKVPIESEVFIYRYSEVFDGVRSPNSFVVKFDIWSVEGSFVEE